MQIQKQNKQQLINSSSSSKNKCKTFFVGCSFGFCNTNLAKFSNGKISNYFFNNKNKIKKVLSIKEPPKCPAIGLFPPLSENKNYIPIIGKQLFDEMEQCINNIELAIIKLEQINTQKNLLKEIDNTLEAINNNKNNNKIIIETDKNNNNEETFFLIEQFVLQVKDLFNLARNIEKIIPSFFEELCSDCPLMDEEISSEQMFSKKFAKILEASIRFDTLKVATPTLQNCFSLFRRMCLLKNLGNIYNLNAPLSDQIALFLSRPSPLFTALINSSEHFISRQKCRELAISHLIEAFIVIYNVMKKMFYRLCQNQQENNFINSDYRKEFLLRSMMGILLITDHLDKNNGGIFIPSNSSFDICNFIEIVKMGSSLEEANKILATLRFMSKHFSDGEIPVYIRKMFEINK